MGMAVAQSVLPIYLDYNATTPVAPDVVAAMMPYWMDHFHNPSASYPEAIPVREAMSDARMALAALLGAKADGIVWTSGGTESNNLALRGSWTFWHAKRRRILISEIEHPAVTATAESLRAAGADVVRLPVDEDGIVRLDALDAALDERTALVSVMLANNEIGTIQPVAEVVRRARAVGAWVHTDASQAVGKLPVDVLELGVDLLTVAGHKLYAPKGIGALYIRPGLDLPPFMTGGGQENGLRSGTENVPYIVGLGAASRLAQSWLEQDGPTRQAQLRDELETRLMDSLPGTHVFGRGVPRLSNTVALSVPGWSGASLLAACPDIRAGTGSACHNPEGIRSPTLRAMGVDPARARGLVRLSLGRATTESDIATVVQTLVRAAGTHSIE